MGFQFICFAIYFALRRRQMTFWQTSTHKIMSHWIPVFHPHVKIRVLQKKKKTKGSHQARAARATLPEATSLLRASILGLNPFHSSRSYKFACLSSLLKEGKIKMFLFCFGKLEYGTRTCMLSNIYWR